MTRRAARRIPRGVTPQVMATSRLLRCLADRLDQGTRADLAIRLGTSGDTEVWTIAVCPRAD